MALRITTNKDEFLLMGKLDCTTAPMLKKHLQFVLESVTEISLNLNGLSAVDLHGMNTLKNLLTYSKEHEKRIWLAGDVARDILNENNMTIA